jgi:uncharacterized protein YabE (DUF348 family)
VLRSVKYGLYGAVLAGVVSGTVAWQSVDKTVHLVVDGNASSVHTTQSRVSDVLAAKGYAVGPHDIVAPRADASVRNGATIVLQRGRLLVLDVNGVRSQVWTTAPTVAAAMAQLGYSTANFTSVSRDRRLPLTPTDLTIRTPQTVTVKHDGRTDKVATTDLTVGQLLDDLGMHLTGKDTVSPGVGAHLKAGLVVRVHRVVKGSVTKDGVLPYATTVRHTATLPVGQTVVLTPGRNGLVRRTYSVVWIDGKVAGKAFVGVRVVRQPTTRVIKVGTAGASASTATGPVPTGTMATPAQAQEIAKQLLAARGWSSQFLPCLAPLWGHESGWRVNAANSSGAYGIPQALPGSKMATAGANWQTSARTQITWGLDYIAAHYGTPCGAWSFWQAHSWY